MNCYKFLPGHVVYFNQRTCANGGQNCLHQCFNIFFHHKWKKELGDTFKRFLTPKRCSTPEEIIILCTTPNVKTIDFDKSVNMNYFLVINLKSIRQSFAKRVSVRSFFQTSSFKKNISTSIIK